MISKDILDVLACPQCKGCIILAENGNGLICEKCKLLYPVKEGMPIMLVEEAVSISV